MSNFSEEKIEIGGKEYTLFLNRKGIVAFEKYTQESSKKIEKIQEAYNDDLNKENKPLSEENPFEDISDVDEETIMMEKMFMRLYWIMLYTNHKLSFNEFETLWEKAKEEYGLSQLGELGNQMLEDANKDFINQNNLKKLTALRPKN